MIKTFVIDLFAGAGGTTSAVFESNTNISVVACINHDANAIKSHAANYPNCIHFTEDIRTVGLEPLVTLCVELRKENPGCKIAVWASLECTNHSRAKGGIARDADSRTLAEHLFRYHDALNPDFFWIENVREFMMWGPLDKTGRPIPEYKGCDYNAWVEEFKVRGYSYDCTLLNAADYGAYTSRIRYFGQFSKDATLISWPEPTHSKTSVGNNLKPWRAVKEVLDLKDSGISIFERKKPLAEATLERIYAGLTKFVVPGGDSFLCSYYKNSTFVGPNSPCGTLTTKDRFQKVVVEKDNQFLLNPQYQSKGSSLDKPCFTLIARMDKAPPYIISTEQKVSGAEHCVQESPAMQKIILFMKEHGLTDIKMRMLKITEMLKIQGFSEAYRLVGTQAEQKKYIGNSVEVTVGKSLFQAIDSKIQQHGNI
jgi:DNA (cytosine-5)-methyltransferase 1